METNRDFPEETESERPVLLSNFLLDHVGEVILTLNSSGLSWNLIESTNNEEGTSFCLGIKLPSNGETAIMFSDTYAVEFIGCGLVYASALANAGGLLSGYTSEIYRFTVHGVQRTQNQPLWVPSLYTFGHKDLDTCQMWVNQITASLNREKGRPKSLLVFVHPKSGKGNGCRNWETVAPIFSRAKIKTKVIVTERAGQALDIMSSITNKELCSYDGAIAVGGDGFFNEILNGLLSSRLKVSYPPAPPDFIHSLKDNNTKAHDVNEIAARTSDHIEATSPLLPGSGLNDSRSANCGAEVNDSTSEDQVPEFSLPNKWFRFGIIPAGSTDAIVICTTGARDPITSALHIVLGKKVRIDIAQVVRWKVSSTSKDEPCVRYAASFAGYGFYGDVITDSEKFRWMGPKRYDYAGTRVFLKHRSYEAELSYLEAEDNNGPASVEVSSQNSRKRPLFGRPKRHERTICRVNCDVCNRNEIYTSQAAPSQNTGELKWSKTKGHFLSIGAAIISCRNEKAPDGLVADAHLSDGYLHLILIKDCPRALYLWHLIQLAKKGGNPLKFEFVEHHKTKAFTFTSLGEESVWNVDGELFHAHKLSAQVLRGLVNLFATGPEV